MIQRTATIIGATGLIGKHLVQQLEQDEYYKTIRILTRRPIQVEGNKIEVKLINFSDRESFKLAIEGSNVVFCAVGTTQKKVKGDKDAYRKVDYSIPVNAAKYCKESNCEQFLIVSAIGADPKSSNFYLQLKGEAENALINSGLQSISIFRPSILLGEREESRPAESVSKLLMKSFSFLLAGKLKKYKPIEAWQVAKSMIMAAKENKKGVNIFTYSEMSRL